MLLKNYISVLEFLIFHRETVGLITTHEHLRHICLFKTTLLIFILIINQWINILEYKHLDFPDYTLRTFM